MMWFLGIDTSNYTTSAALYNGGTLLQEKLPLPVKEGELGLRQSDAVFLHVKQLPILLETLLPQAGGNLAGVGVSTRPRDVEGSYMPCFLSGELAARSIAAGLGVSCHFFSHQAGHIVAVLLGSGSLELIERPFLAMHLSGGTTECLLVRPGAEQPFDITLLGHTLDLSAGQVIDRVGKMLGLAFPAGPALEQLAAHAQGGIRPKTVLKQANCCFSGLENQCRTLLEQGEAPARVARFCQESVGNTVLQMAKKAQELYPGLPFVFGGGVMSNQSIRRLLQAHLPDARFATPALSADNAAGTAVLTQLAHQRGLAPC
ncbi:MAG: peptidase M22 [Oscillospiraceae bacterium]|jgi:N6-L-threonylcarbamoyladenine synthase